MALPVHKIMAQLQEGVDTKGAEAEEKGDICYQNKGKGKKRREQEVDSIRWECSKRRHMGCPFQIFTSLPENGAPIKALSMKKPQVHTCSAEKLTPLMHKFRLKLASRMQDDLDLSWTKIWNKRGNFFSKK